MEDVLEVYQRSYDPKRPVVCMDETSKQLVGETRVPMPAAPGQTIRHDYEYERNGVENLFIAFEPLAGWRHVEVTEHRTRVDWAEFMRFLLDKQYPHAERVTLVMDNLNTHSGGSLYEAFPPEQARSYCNRLEIHYTPKHGSWLNMAESEFSVLKRQCTDRRIPDKETIEREVAAWVKNRNAARIGANWQFTTHDARTKLARLYPSFEV